MTTHKHASLPAPAQPRVRTRNRPLETAVAVGAAALAGLVIARAMPYGPITPGQVWITMATGLAVGLIAGWALRSRWAMLVAPLVHLLVIELARPAVAGPTAGAIRLDNAYGILTLMVGRGFHGVVGLLPMVLGAGLGVLLARTRPGAAPAAAGGGRARALVRWLPLALLAAAVAALAVLNGIPARTPPVLDAAGNPVPGSLASLETVRLGGHDQVIQIRAHSPDLPVMLYLSGGPGQSDLPYARVLFADLAEDFVMVSWDQRGTGKSYPALEPAATLTLDQAVADTIALTNYLRQRFDEEKIYLLGESWGTTLGVLAVQQRPELYHAWIGSGQMVSQLETDRRLYDDVLALAQRTGNTALAEQMTAFGPPPYADTPYPNAVVMGQYEALYLPYTPPADYIRRGTEAGLGPWGILGSEYNLVEKVNVLRGLIDMFTVLYPQLQEIDFRQDVPRLAVPVYVLDGAAELTARRDLALEWFGLLDAPQKQLFTFDNAGHSVAFEQFSAFHRILTDTILPETYPGR